MMKLYTRPEGCPPCNAAKDIVAQKGITVEQLDATQEENQEFLKSNNLARVPVLQLEDGAFLMGTPAVQYLMKLKV